ncbi:MAG TPA: vitamin K epoxide reductase family protein [Terriglobales bacterium]|nr:vitamin K epoxide reductase family protein [Terriglobales bacterium]
MKDKLGLLIILLSLVGAVLSGVSLYNHYKSTPTDYCDLGDNFNCDIVNRSIYSEVAKIPVAGIGLAGYIALLVLARLPRTNRLASTLLLIGALGGLAYSLYLTYVEKYLLATWCIICLGSLATIAVIFVVALTRHLQKSQAIFVAQQS